MWIEGTASEPAPSNTFSEKIYFADGVRFERKIEEGKATKVEYCNDSKAWSWKAASSEESDDKKQMETKTDVLDPDPVYVSASTEIVKDTGMRESAKNLLDWNKTYPDKPSLKQEHGLNRAQKRLWEVVEELRKEGYQPKDTSERTRKIMDQFVKRRLQPQKEADL
ncbi:MAG: hypothetical protein V1899_07660 [Planctomycetota bacterium]